MAFDSAAAWVLLVTVMSASASAAEPATPTLTVEAVRGRLKGIEDSDKLDADLAKAMLSIGATKGIEFGAGFAAADMMGSEHNDPMDASGFLSNNAGGVLGGISTGEEIVFRVAVKPTSSIGVEQRTVDLAGKETTTRTEGRHDPCICPRIVPVVEAMCAIVLEDHFKRQAASHRGAHLRRFCRTAGNHLRRCGPAVECGTDHPDNRPA